jgi:hypothetical protein
VYVIDSSFTVHPLGSGGPSDPQPTARMHPFQTPAKRTPPRRVVVPRRCLAGLRRAPQHCLHEPVSVRSGRGPICFRANWMRLVRCIFSMQTNTSPLVSTLRPWPICCRHGELEQDVHQRRCKSLYFSGQSKLRKRKQLPNSPLQFVNLRPDKHGMEITPEKLQICSYANNLHLLHHAVVERSQAANSITYFFLHLIQLLKDDDFVGSFLVH